MARVSKEYGARLKEFITAAQQLFFQKGYERTSVNDIINAVGVAKGTFYHYFTSKEDLLEKLVEEFTTETYKFVKDIVDRRDLDALQKLHAIFDAVYTKKLENLKLMKMLMKVMYRDENLIIRYKIFRRNMEYLVPEYCRIFRQGTEESHFNIAEPEETAEIIFTLGTNLNESIVNLLLKSDQHPDLIEKIKKKIKVFGMSMERLLGAKEDTIHLFRDGMIDAFIPNEKNRK